MSGALRPLDDHRAWRGIAGGLTLLRSKGQGQYEQIFEVTAGWSAWHDQSNRLGADPDSVPVLVAQVEEPDDAVSAAALAAALAGGGAADPADSFAVEGVVYQLEREHTVRPLASPRRWALRGYYTEGRWPVG